MLEEVAGRVGEPVVVTGPGGREGLAVERARTLRLGEAGPTTGTGGPPAPRRPDPENLAYVIYTSGSTGRPKGVMNTHRAIVNRLLWMQRAYRISPGDRVLQKTPMSFDVSVWEFFWPLLAGASLVFARPEGHKDPAYLRRLVETAGITTLHFVPSMLRAFVEECGIERCRPLVRVITSGEALPPDLAHRLLAQTPADLHNLYGPTEAAVDVTFHRATAADVESVPIGRPISNTAIHLLDRAHRPVPAGVPGELYIGGTGLARGYLARPALTAERFVPDPLGESPGGRLYRTGDLTRRRADGAVEFLGRLDHQVKVRGFRIELGEIEAVLGRHPGVRSAAVTAGQDGAGGRRLVAYLVPEPERAPAGEDLRAYLAERLPDFMVPAGYLFLDAFPLTPSGKLDRKALPVPGTEDGAVRREYVAPRTPLEELLAGIWSEVLGVERVGIEDSFLALGGHSLLAVRVMILLYQTLGLRLPVLALFEAPTLGELVERLEASLGAADRVHLEAVFAEVGEVEDQEARALLAAAEPLPPEGARHG